MKKPIIVLTGPTAVGKTEISIELAKAAGGEIISADSMQVYKQMDIGTAKIKKEQMQGVTHYMIDEWNPDEEFNVMIFQKRVKEIMEDIYNRGKIPILVGGATASAVHTAVKIAPCYDHIVAYTRDAAVMPSIMQEIASDPAEAERRIKAEQESQRSAYAESQKPLLQLEEARRRARRRYPP